MNDVVVQKNIPMRVPPRSTAEPSQQELPNNRIEKNPFFSKEPVSAIPPNSEKKPRSRMLPLVLVGVLFFAAFFTLLSYFFSSATIEIVPQSEATSVSHEFVALKDSLEDELAFQFLSLTEEKSKEIPATIETKIQKKASGKVVIYNSYNADNQKLIKNTRLESPDGKIFRIDESVVVPGAKMTGGKVVTPGSVEVIAYADVPGKEYNIGLSDFTIPGLKGSPRYAKFSARSDPNSPIGRGFSGTIKVPSDEDVASARAALRDDVKTLAIEKAQAQIPAGNSFFPGSTVVKFEDVPQDPSETSTFTVSVRATASVFFFDTTRLIKKIAGVTLKDYKDEPIDITNIQALSFSFLDPIDDVILSDITRVKFSLKGGILFVWRVDTDKLIAEAAGKEKKDLGKIVGAQGYIKTAEAVVRPVWKTVFPSDPNKISVKIINP